MIEKLKALAQWWYLLERTQHRHWCHGEEELRGEPNCEHLIGCWYCNGITCAGIERVNCAKCVTYRLKYKDGGK